MNGEITNRGEVMEFKARVFSKQLMAAVADKLQHLKNDKLRKYIAIMEFEIGFQLYTKNSKWSGLRFYVRYIRFDYVQIQFNVDWRPSSDHLLVHLTTKELEDEETRRKIDELVCKFLVSANKEFLCLSGTK